MPLGKDAEDKMLRRIVQAVRELSNEPREEEESVKILAGTWKMQLKSESSLMS